MPKPTELTGRRFGKLTVVGRGEPELSDSGKTKYGTWMVVCDCGGEEVLRDHRLPYCATNLARRDVVEACEACRSERSCSVCSKRFQSVAFRACCSDACQLIHRRRIDLDAYHRRFQRDPEVNKRRAAKVRATALLNAAVAEKLRAQEKAKNARHAERMRTDPEYAEAQRQARRQAYAEKADAVQAARRARRAESADLQARMKAWARDYWQAHAQEIMAQRRQRQEMKLAAMSDHERQDFEARRRERNRLYADQARTDPIKRQRMNAHAAAARDRQIERMTPAELAAWIERRRERERRRREDETFQARARKNTAAWRQRKALDKLMGTADALVTRMDRLNSFGDDDDDGTDITTE